MAKINLLTPPAIASLARRPERGVSLCRIVSCLTKVSNLGPTPLSPRRLTWRDQTFIAMAELERLKGDRVDY